MRGATLIAIAAICTFAKVAEAAAGTGGNQQRASSNRRRNRPSSSRAVDPDLPGKKQQCTAAAAAAESLGGVWSVGGGGAGGSRRFDKQVTRGDDLQLDWCVVLLVVLLQLLVHTIQYVVRALGVKILLSKQTTPHAESNTSSVFTSSVLVYSCCAAAGTSAPGHICTRLTTCPQFLLTPLLVMFGTMLMNSSAAVGLFSVCWPFRSEGSNGHSRLCAADMIATTN